MEKKDLQEDIAIFVKLNCEYTERFFGWSDEMNKYKGTVQVIDSFSHNNDHCLVKFYDTRFNWSIRDLELIPKSPKPKSVHFDTKELVL